MQCACASTFSQLPLKLFASSASMQVSAPSCSEAHVGGDLGRSEWIIMSKEFAYGLIGFLPKHVVFDPDSPYLKNLLTSPPAEYPATRFGDLARRHTVAHRKQAYLRACASLWPLYAGDLRVCRCLLPVRQPACSCHLIRLATENGSSE